MPSGIVGITRPSSLAVDTDFPMGMRIHLVPKNMTTTAGLNQIIVGSLPRFRRRWVLQSGSWRLPMV